MQGHFVPGKAIPEVGRLKSSNSRGRPGEAADSLRELHGKTWFQTGDVGVKDEKGCINLKGRAKGMITVSGFKVCSVVVEDKLYRWGEERL